MRRAPKSAIWVVNTRRTEAPFSCKDFMQPKCIYFQLLQTVYKYSNLKKHSADKLLFTCGLNFIQTKFMYTLVYLPLKPIAQYTFILLPCVKLRFLWERSHCSGAEVRNGWGSGKDDSKSPFQNTASFWPAQYFHINGLLSHSWV